MMTSGSVTGNKNHKENERFVKTNSGGLTAPLRNARTTIVITTPGKVAKTTLKNSNAKVMVAFHSLSWFFLIVEEGVALIILQALRNRME